MDTLTNYITERIRIDNIKQVKFPVDGTLEDIIQFLKKNGFVELTMPPAIYIIKGFNKTKIRGFHINPVTARIWFADTSNDPISKDNPVFLILRSDNTNELYYDNEKLDKPRTKSDFLEMVNKCLF